MIEKVTMHTDDRFISKFKGYRISIAKQYNDDLYDFDISKNNEIVEEQYNVGFLTIEECIIFCKKWVNENK